MKVEFFTGLIFFILLAPIAILVLMVLFGIVDFLMFLSSESQYFFDYEQTL